MKKIWFRVGMSAEITEEEFKTLSQNDEKGEQLFVIMLRQGRFYPDGESYAPDNDGVTNAEFYTISEEINYDLYIPREAMQRSIVATVEQTDLQTQLEDYIEANKNCLTYQPTTEDIKSMVDDLVIKTLSRYDENITEENLYEILERYGFIDEE